MRILLVGLVIAMAGPAQAGRRPSDAERGRELWERHCQACHGEHARGDGPAAADLVVPVPSAAGVVTQDRIGELVDVVLWGRGAMPGYEATFDKYDARRVLRTMAGLASRPVPVPVVTPQVVTPPARPPADPDEPAPTDLETDASETDASETDGPSPVGPR
jgi:mono/diheme cytochrome c family protein